MAAQMIGEEYEIRSSSLNGGGGVIPDAPVHGLALLGTSIGQASPLGLSASAGGAAFALGGFWQAAGGPISVPCEGDCDGDGMIGINELIKGVNIALGNAELDECRAMDSNGDSAVTVSELIKAVRNALDGCDAVGGAAARTFGARNPGPDVVGLQGKLQGVEFLQRSSLVDLEVSLWDEPVGGMVLFGERHPNTRLLNGVFAVHIGSGEVLHGAFSRGLFSGDGRWLELAVDGEPIGARQQIGSVPYALRAGVAETALEADSIGGVSGDDLVSLSGATFTGPIDVLGSGSASSARITSVSGRPDHGLIAVGAGSEAALAMMSIDSKGNGAFALLDVGGNSVVAIASEAAQEGESGGAGLFGQRRGVIRTWAPNGSLNGEAGTSSLSLDRGRISVRGEESETRAFLEVRPRGEAALWVFGANGTVNAVMGADENDPDRGAVSIRDGEGRTRIVARVNDKGEGELETRGPGGSRNVRVGSNQVEPERGGITLYDEAGMPRLLAFSNASGGILSASDPAGVARALVDGSGIFLTFGPNGAINSRLGWRDDGINSGEAAVADSAGTSRARLFVDSESRARTAVIASGGAEAALLSVLDSGSGRFGTKGANGEDNVAVGVLASNESHGFLNVADSGGNGRSQLFAGSDGRGRLSIRAEQGAERVAFRMGRGVSKVGVVHTVGANGSENVTLSAGIDTDRNRGFASVRDAAGEPRAEMSILAGYGELYLRGPNDNRNVSVLDGIVVADGNGSNRASLTAKVVSADLKNFVTDHPTRPGSKIVYTTVEGPEAGIFHRGRVELRNGRAEIALPEHFVALAVPESVTVQLTPMSSKSRGVGIAAIEPDRIEVGELHGGNGEYELSFVVHALRRSHRDYQPVVDAKGIESTARLEGRHGSES